MGDTDRIKALSKHAEKIKKAMEDDLDEYSVLYDSISDDELDPIDGTPIKKALMTKAERKDFLERLKDEHLTQSACISCPDIGMCGCRDWNCKHPWVMVTGCSQHPDQVKYKGHSTTIVITDTTVSTGMDYPSTVSWNDCRTKTTCSTLYTAHIPARAGYTNQVKWYADRGAYVFDTSGVPTGSTIISAKVQQWITNIYYYYNDPCLLKFQTGGGTYPHNPVVVGDYDYSNYSGDGGGISIGNATPLNQYNDMPMNATGLTWINMGAGAKTRFILRDYEKDTLNSAPTVVDKFDGIFCTQGGSAGTYPPKFSITYDPPVPPPDPPTNLTAIGSVGQIALAWTKSVGATGYRVYRGPTSGSETLYQTLGDVDVYNDTVGPGLTYFYKVTATNPAESGYSNEANASTPNVPGAPTSLTATLVGGGIDLAWVAPVSDGGSPITGYKVYRGSGGTGTETLYQTLGVVLTYNDSSLGSNHNYYYKVKATNAAGNGAYSNEANATTLNSPLVSLSYRKMMTIDHTKILASLTDFPVAVILNAGNFDFSKCLSNGFDIRFTESDGVTLLKYEREKHDSVAQQAVYWVKIPAVSDTIDTTFYIYYGNADAFDGQDAPNVWTNKFELVCHMSNGPLWKKRSSMVIAPNTGYFQNAEPTVIYEGNPQVLIGEPNVFKMWYRTCHTGDNLSSIRYAESLDGITWTDYGSFILTGVTKYVGPYVVKDGSDYYMYVHSNWWDHAIDRYISVDGVNWTLDASNCLPLGVGAWDDIAIGNNCVWKEGPNDWRMMYEGRGNSHTNWAIGYATSTDGKVWVKYVGNPVITEPTGGCGSAQVIKKDGVYYIYYLESPTGLLPTDIARAYSFDLINWTKCGGNSYPIFFRTEGWEGKDDFSGGQTADPHLIEVNGKTYMFYSGGTQTDLGIGMAVSDKTILQLLNTYEMRNVDSTGKNIFYYKASMVSGQVGEGRVFNGITDYENTPNPSMNFGTGGLTVEYLFKTVVSPIQNKIIAMRQDSNNGGHVPYFVCGIDIYGDVIADFAGVTNPGITLISLTGGYNDGVWHHVVNILDDPANTASIYVDNAVVLGPLATSTTDMNFSSGPIITPLNIGRNEQYWISNVDDFYGGDLDEVRISSEPRSASWIQATYNTLKNTLISSYGIEQAVTNLVATGLINEIKLTWVAPLDNGGSPITGYKVYRGPTSGSETLYQTLGVVLFYDDTGLPLGSNYYYKIKAVNAVGDSGFSNEDDGSSTSQPSGVRYMSKMGVFSPSYLRKAARGP